MKTSIISKTVLLLSLISLFTDMASEMVYPVLPLYMESIGISIIGIGVLEGIAQATAGLSKGYFGRWSDLSLRRMPFVQLGYGLSALSKPFLAFANSGLSVLFVRFGDRLGKGIRTGARDALLSDYAKDENRGRVFGFHRAMDSFGAALGPLLALGFLWVYPEDYKTLFIIAFIPGALAILTSFLIKENKNTEPKSSKRPLLKDLINYLGKSSKQYKRLIIGLLFFSLINSTDLFLLLYLKTQGVSDSYIIGIYIMYNLVFALAAYPAGSLGDRFTLKSIFLIGLSLFSLTYIGLGITSGSSMVYFAIIFVIYGLFAACTDGITKAWITNVVDGKEVGSAIGNFEAFNSIAIMLANVMGGIIWYTYGAAFYFIVTGLLALLGITYFLIFTDNEKIQDLNTVAE